MSVSVLDREMFTEAEAARLLRVPEVACVLPDIERRQSRWASRSAPMAGDVLIASGLLAGQGSVSSGHSSPVALLISAARSSRARSGSTS